MILDVSKPLTVKWKFLLKSPPVGGGERLLCFLITNSRDWQADTFVLTSSLGFEQIAIIFVHQNKYLCPSLLVLSAHIYICMYVCIYIYIYIHTYIHIFFSIN